MIEHPQRGPIVRARQLARHVRQVVAPRRPPRSARRVADVHADRREPPAPSDQRAAEVLIERGADRYGAARTDLRCRHVGGPEVEHDSRVGLHGGAQVQGVLDRRGDAVVGDDARDRERLARPRVLDAVAILILLASQVPDRRAVAALRDPGKRAHDSVRRADFPGQASLLDPRHPVVMNRPVSRPGAGIPRCRHQELALVPIDRDRRAGGITLDLRQAIDRPAGGEGAAERAVRRIAKPQVGGESMPARRQIERNGVGDDALILPDVRSALDLHAFGWPGVACGKRRAVRIGWCGEGERGGAEREAGEECDELTRAHPQRCRKHRAIVKAAELLASLSLSLSASTVRLDVSASASAASPTAPRADRGRPRSS